MRIPSNEYGAGGGYGSKVMGQGGSSRLRAEHKSVDVNAAVYLTNVLFNLRTSGRLTLRISVHLVAA
jgi:hypothetical protein